MRSFTKRQLKFLDVTVFGVCLEGYQNQSIRATLVVAAVVAAQAIQIELFINRQVDFQNLLFPENLGVFS